MESEKKHCFSCRYYSPYYTKGYTKFDKCDIGLYGRKKATVEKHEICEKYNNMYYARIDRKKAALEAIAEHINILSEIKQILEEDDDEAFEELILNFKNRKK